MSASVPDSVITWLGQNPGLIKYLTIDERFSCSISARDLCARISERLVDEIDAQAPSLLPPTRRPGHLGGRAALAFNRRFFCEKLLRELKQAQFDSASTAIVRIDELLSGPLSGDISISVNCDLLFQDLFSDSPQMVSLRSHARYLGDEISDATSYLADGVSQRCLLTEILEVSSWNYLSDFAFLLPSSLQDNVETLFEYDKVISGCIGRLVVANNRPRFILDVERLAVTILSRFELSAEQGNVLFAMAFRHAFGCLYASRGFGLCTNDSCSEIDSIARFLDRLTFADLCPPEEFCPPHEAGDLVGRSFRSFEAFYGVVDALERLRFETNPLDVLGWMSRAIKGIEAVIAGSGVFQDAIIPFDTLFGLLVASLAAAEVPDVCVCCRLVEEYVTPEVSERLNSSFQFAQANLKGVAEHLRTMAAAGESEFRS
jgi:hypothetical protein